MDKKYQVFVSSTYRDLVEERAAVTQCLLECDCIPVGMEQFPANDLSPMQYIEKLMDTCDYYILILAGKYGSIDKDGVGFTEKEYDYAISRNIPVMAFVVDDINKLTVDKYEQQEDKREKLNKFREKVLSSKLVKRYSNSDSLKAGVAISLMRCIKDFPAVGWIRADSIATESIEDKIEAYLKEHEVTKEDIEKMFEENKVSVVYENNKAGGQTVVIDNAKKLYNENKKSSIDIRPIQKEYLNNNYEGYFEFDYSNNNGEFTIGKNDYEFTTKWSKASDVSIHAYSASRNIDSIARIKLLDDIPNELVGSFDFSSRVRTANIGDAIIWKNTNGNYALTKIIEIFDDSRGKPNDKLLCKYVIYK